VPDFAANFEQIFAQSGTFSLSPGPVASVISAALAPLIALVGWFIGGSVIHVAAKAFGGAGRFGQTLAATGLAYSANLLGLVQIVPYADFFAGSVLVAAGLLGLIASYVAVRETHGLPAWRSFWAVTLGPLLLGLLLVTLYCCFVLLFAGALGGIAQGASR
jgi:Yip1 domain